MTDIAVEDKQFSSETVLSEEQQAAFDAFFAWWNNPKKEKQVFSIAGPAGSGKSTVLAFIAKQALQSPDVNLAFCTLTGRASLVCKSSLEAAGVTGHTYCGTIHGMLYIPEVDAATGRVKSWKKAPELPYTLIICDESSMVDVEIGNDLASYGIPILAIGDAAQLPPVSGPPAYTSAPDFTLTQIHRQALENPIIRLSMGVRRGASISKMCNWIDQANDPRVEWLVGDSGLLEALEMARPPGLLLCYTNAMRLHLNKMARRRYGFAPKDGEAPGPQEGEVIVFTKNYDDRDSSLKFFNGERAKILKIEDNGPNHYRALLQMRGTEIECRRMSKHQFGKKAFEEFGDIPYLDENGEETGKEYKSWGQVAALCDYGTCLSIHKSQGSSAKCVSLICENIIYKLDPEERSKLLYTGISRASTHLLLVTDV